MVMVQVVEPCDEWLDDVSGWLDGEATVRRVDEVERHVGSCSGCSGFVEATRRSRRGSLRAVPQPSASVTAPTTRLPSVVTRIEDEFRSPVVLRSLLAVVAAQVMFFSLMAIFDSGTAASIHDARHLGSFGVAYAVGLATVVHRPARARAMLPVAFVLVGSLAITAIVDVVEHRVPLVSEGAHLPELISVGLVWGLARSNSKPQPR